MAETRQLAKGFRRNTRILERMTEGISHEESLIAPPYDGNALNWIVGHIALSRNGVLNLLGIDPVEPHQLARYEKESAPVTPKSAYAVPFDDLREICTRMGDQIVEALNGLDDAALDKSIHGILWHETYHIGQLEILRRVLGRDDMRI